MWAHYAIRDIRLDFRQLRLVFSKHSLTKSVTSSMPGILSIHALRMLLQILRKSLILHFISVSVRYGSSKIGYALYVASCVVSLSLLSLPQSSLY